jgi:hypothetical protein
MCISEVQAYAMQSYSAVKRVQIFLGLVPAMKSHHAKGVIVVGEDPAGSQGITYSEDIK